MLNSTRQRLLIISGILFLIISIWSFIISLLDRIPPINETTMTCLVTGASSGIGSEISREMVKRGWKVIGIARRLEKLKNLEHELGQAFIPYVCDVGQTDQIHLVCEQIKKRIYTNLIFFERRNRHH